MVVLAVPATGLANTKNGARTEAAVAHTHPHTSRHLDRRVVVLQFGSGYATPRGSARVKGLQRRLATAGFSPGPVDGRYGPRTEQAVRDFQTATGLAVDGIAGPKTQAAILRSHSTVYPGAGLTGPSSQRVRVLQRRLVRAGLNPGLIDGRYGPDTEQGVRRFQTQHGLAVTGIAGPATIDLLHILAAVPAATQTRRPSSPRVRVWRPPARRVPLSSGQRVRVPSGRRVRHGARPRPTTSPSPVPVPAGTRRTSAPTGGGSAAPSAVFLVALALLLGLSMTWFAYRERRRRWTTTEHSSHRSTGARWIAVPEPEPQPTHLNDQPKAPTRHSPSIDQAGLTVGPERRDDAEGWFRHALEMQQQGQVTAAVSAYRQADELGHGGAAANLGVLYEQHGNHTAAEDCYRRADHRGDPDGAFNLAVALEEQDQPAAAAAAYKRADQRGHPKAAANLGVLLEGQGDLRGAEECYRRGDERGDPNGAFNLAVLLQEAGNPIGALRAYERASQLGDAQVSDMARAAAQELKTQLRPTASAATEVAHPSIPGSQ